MKGSHPLLKPALEAAALAALLCGVTAAVALVMGLSGQRLMTLYCVNLCAVLAFQIFSGNSGIVSFGHTAFMAVGAYVSAWLTMPTALQRTALPNLPAWLAGHELAVPLALVFVLLAGLALAALSGMPIARLNGASASIATLGFLIVVYSVLAAARDFTRGNQAFYGVPRATDITLALIFASLFIVAARLYKDSRYGLMMRAVRDNETAALTLGVSPQRMRYVAWLISGGLATVAGALYGHMLGAFTPKDFYFHMAFIYVAMLIVGGMGTVTGAVVGVGLVMVLQEVLQEFERGFTLGPIQIPEIFGVPIVGVSLAMLLVLWLLGGRQVQLRGDLLDRGAPTHRLVHLVEEHHLLLVFFVRLTCIDICVSVGSSEEVCSKLYLRHILWLLLRIRCHKIFACSYMRQILY